MAESSPQPNLLTLTDDMLTHIASFLPATDLARLSLAAKRFTAPPTEGPAEAPGLSLLGVGAAARGRVVACTGFRAGAAAPPAALQPRPRRARAERRHGHSQGDGRE